MRFRPSAWHLSHGPAQPWIRAALFTILLCVSVIRIDAQSFRFAWLSDCHVGARTGAEDLAASVEQINALPDIAFVIISGDVTEAGSRQELTVAKDILAKLRVPLHILPGNHDTKWSESGATDFARIFGDDRFAFVHEGFVFVGVHEGPVMRMTNGHFAPQDLRWLDETLARLADSRQPVVFVTHYPLDAGITNWFEVVDRLKKYNTQVALFGHGHANRPYEFEGIPGVMTRANVADAQRPPGFTVVTVSEGRMTFSEQRRGGEAVPAWHAVALGDRADAFRTARRSPRPDFGLNAHYTAVKPRWVRETGWTVVSAPAIAGGIAVIGDGSGKVRSFSLDTGAPGWTFGTGGPVRATPAGAGDLVVVPSTDGNVYALGVRDGALKWRFTSDRPIVACPQIADGIVYLGASDGRFRALRLADGKLLWEYPDVKSFVETRPLVHGGKVYFGAWDRTFYALDAGTGALAWTWHEPRAGRFYSPAACWPVAGRGKVFIVDPDRKIVALDANTGTQIWVHGENGPARESIGVSADGERVYVPAISDFIRAYSTAAEKPEVVWETNAKFGPDYNAAMVAEKDGVMFYGTKNGVLIALDGATGAIRWQHRVGVAALNTPVPLGASDVVVTDHQGQVVRLTAGPASNRVEP